MSRTQVRKGELKQLRELVAKIVDELIDIKHNHIHSLNIKMNFVLFVILPILFILVSCIVVVLARE